MIQRIEGGTINVCMAAVRRLAYEAAGFWSVEPRTRCRHPSSQRVRKLGSRLGNWLTANEALAFWQSPDCRTLTGKRNRAMLAILLGCGLRRRELAELTCESLQRRKGRWAIVDLVGKGRHIRTVPVPNWVKETLDAWLGAADISEVHYFDVSAAPVGSGATAFQKRQSGTSSRRLPRV
jgi:site-specific recombinase XerD